MASATTFVGRGSAWDHGAGDRRDGQRAILAADDGDGRGGRWRPPRGVGRGRRPGTSEKAAGNDDPLGAAGADAVRRIGDVTAASCQDCGGEHPIGHADGGVGEGRAWATTSEPAAVDREVEPPAVEPFDAPVTMAPVAAPGGERPLPPLPDGGLTLTMPDWLRAPPAAPARTDGDPAIASPPLPAAVEREVVADGPGTVAIDPASFLTEDDLPAWIRQLVANDAAVKAETRRGETAAAAEAHQHVLPPAAEPPRLPTSRAPALTAAPAGSTELPAGGSRGWLGGSEQAGASAAACPSTETPRSDDGRAVGEERTPVLTEVVGQRSPASEPAAAPLVFAPAAPAGPVAPPASRPVRVERAPRGRRLRPIGLAIGLVLLALIAFLVRSGMLR